MLCSSPPRILIKSIIEIIGHINLRLPPRLVGQLINVNILGQRRLEAHLHAAGHVDQGPKLGALRRGEARLCGGRLAGGGRGLAGKVRRDPLAVARRRGGGGRCGTAERCASRRPLRPRGLAIAVTALCCRGAGASASSSGTSASAASSPSAYSAPSSPYSSPSPSSSSGCINTTCRRPRRASSRRLNRLSGAPSAPSAGGCFGLRVRHNNIFA